MCSLPRMRRSVSSRTGAALPHRRGAGEPSRRRTGGHSRRAGPMRRSGARDGTRIVRAMASLLAVPNVSEGRDEAVLDAIGDAFGSGAQVLDRHADPDHHRAVFSLVAEPDTLATAPPGRRERGGRAHRSARAARRSSPRRGDRCCSHRARRSGAARRCLRAGARHRRAARRGARAAGIPIRGARRRAYRAEIRRGGVANLAARIAEEELTPDFGPRRFTRAPALYWLAHVRRSSRSTWSSPRPRISAPRARSLSASARAVASACRDFARSGSSSNRAGAPLRSR